jgi:hypothetical protein
VVDPPGGGPGGGHRAPRRGSARAGGYPQGAGGVDSASGADAGCAGGADPTMGAGGAADLVMELRIQLAATVAHGWARRACPRITFFFLLFRID